MQNNYQSASFILAHNDNLYATFATNRVTKGLKREVQVQ